jgi:uncharacterized protein (DUF433 family)
MTIEEALWQDPERMSGAVCFRDTRIPVSFLFQYLERSTLEEFLHQYPDISREAATTVIEASQALIESRFPGRLSA